MRIVPCGTITCSPQSRLSCGKKPETTNAPAKPTSAHSPAPVAPPNVPSSKANSGGWQKRDEQRRRGKGETERGGNGERGKRGDGEGVRFLCPIAPSPSTDSRTMPPAI